MLRRSANGTDGERSSVKKESEVNCQATLHLHLTYYHPPPPKPEAFSPIGKKEIFAPGVAAGSALATVAQELSLLVPGLFGRYIRSLVEGSLGMFAFPVLRVGQC